MKMENGRQWFSGESDKSFADAARFAVENAEDALGEIRPEYDVQLQVLADGPLSGYRVLVSPTG